jgi:hypothetical protein
MRPAAAQMAWKKLSLNQPQTIHRKGREGRKGKQEEYSAEHN